MMHWLLGVAMVLLAPLPALVGYSAVVCPAENALGMSLITLLATGLQVPLAAIAYAVVAVSFWPIVAALGDRPRPLKVLRWWGVTVIALGLATSAAAFLLGATGRCSVLW